VKKKLISGDDQFTKKKLLSNLLLFIRLHKISLVTTDRKMRPRRRWVDNIKMDLRETEWGGMYWIDLAQDRDRWRAYVNAVMNLRVP
jgi:hypothetical protein